MSRLGRSQPVPPFSSHGFVDPGPGPVGTVPPRVIVVPPTDERRRLLPPLPPVLLVGRLTQDTQPRVFVVPLTDERRRLLPALPPVALSGTAAVTTSPPTVQPPQIINVDRVDQPVRRFPQQPNILRGPIPGGQIIYHRRTMMGVGQ